MAEDLNILNIPADTEDTENRSLFNSEGQVHAPLSAEKDVNASEEPTMKSKILTLSSPSDSSGDRLAPQPQADSTSLKQRNGGGLKEVQNLSPKLQSLNNTEDKENTAGQPAATSTGNTQEEGTAAESSSQDVKVTTDEQLSSTEDVDAEVLRRAREEGRVNVVFQGTVTQEGCCRFVSEVLKCVLYQRQQLPMTYDQLVYSQKSRQATLQDKDTVSRRPAQSADMDWRKCQQTLQELEEVLQQLEVLFSLSKVPRVLLLMGGSPVLPKELYEINMEALFVAGGDQCLRVSSCLRQIFRTLFVADLLSDTKPVRLMPTIVMVMAHRDCGVGWFRPKQQFKVPSRVKNQVIALSSDPSTCKEPRAEGSDQEDYIWFQAPVAIKGFSK